MIFCEFAILDLTVLKLESEVFAHVFVDEYKNLSVSYSVWAGELELIQQLPHKYAFFMFRFSAYLEICSSTYI